MCPTSKLRHCKCCTILYQGEHPLYCDACLADYPHIRHLSAHQTQAWIWTKENKERMSRRARYQYAAAYINAMLALGAFDMRAVGYCCDEMQVTPRTVRTICRRSDLCPPHLYYAVFQ
jgi:hypothetical protein